MTILLALFAWIFGHASHPNLPEPHEESCTQVRSGAVMTCEAEKGQDSVFLLISNGF